MNDSDLIALLHNLCKQEQEQQWLEFKCNDVTDGQKIGEYVSALSNGATLSNNQFGYLVWGIEDGIHNIKGTGFHFSKKKKNNQSLELFLRKLINPKINFEVFEFECDKKHIVLLRIPAANGEPTRFGQQAFVRVGSHTTKLEQFPDFVRIIYNSQEDWSARIIEKATIGDLDVQALKIARLKFKERNKNVPYYDEIDKWEDITFLDKAKITINGKITNTAIILLGKEESIHYLLPAAAEITWKLDAEEKAYEHFGPPLLLNTTKVMQRIRNVQYKFFPDNQLLAITVDKYDTRSILEALHNCIAHQNYLLNSRIIVTEKIDKLIFSSAGSFFEGNPVSYLTGEKTPKQYRNPWITQAMFVLGMIDRLGYGIHTMFESQRKRFFPMLDYELSQNQEVVLQMYGQVIDEGYSKILMQRENLSLYQILLLDRIQKKFPITDEEAMALKKEKLIEGRKPNYFIGTKIAQTTGQKAAYSKNKALDKQYYLDLILKSINEHENLNRQDIDELLWEKLPDWMGDKQRKNKIKNLIAELKRNDKIVNRGSDAKPEWVLRDPMRDLAEI
jgi:ATP-dependent DNA helicase RecG